MPSKDPINKQANAWMEREVLVSSDRERPSETSSRGRGRIGTRTARREMSAQVLRLAKRLRANPDELAGKIPADTLRRTKYPVIEIENEDGTRTFKHDSGIEEKLIASIRR